MSSRMERVAEIIEQIGFLNRVPPEAAALLDRELERLALYHTERCCDPRLCPEESARHREARLLARGLLQFFDKRKATLREELQKLRSTKTGVRV